MALNLQNYTPPGRVRAATPFRVSASDVNGDVLTELAVETVNDDHPAPFRHTRVSDAEAQQIAVNDMPRFRELVGRKNLNLPSIWVDGPLELALVTTRILRPGTSVLPNGLSSYASDELNETWERVCDLVGELPKDLTQRANNHKTEVLVPQFDRFYDRKAAQTFAALPGSYRQLLQAVSPGPARPELASLMDRSQPLDAIDAALNDSNSYPMVGRYTVQLTVPAWRESVVPSLGQKRADLMVACSAMLTEINACRALRHAGWSSNLGWYLNMDRGPKLVNLMFLQRALRRCTGGNWVDEDRELLFRLAFGVSGHVPFSTFDLLCHAPSTVNLDQRTLDRGNLESVLNNPTVRWDDGTEFFLYDGVNLNPDLVREAVKQPSALLNVRNIEQRRVLLRIVGTDALLQDVKGKLVSRDEFGELYALPNGTQFVVVDNATAEPDGSVRKYILGTIGNSHRTARSGIASTWGLREDQYWPTKET